MTKSTVAGAIAGVTVFAVVFTWQYFRLLAHQPGIATQQPITSYPPSAAWVTALPWSLLAFVTVAIGTFVVGNLRAK
ncbi:MAG: hypothetical protein KF715_00505 [Candidatus Didemnitutus sp.]|nr:hypothetical protein [Candidatus Didemnitutus sp.]